MDVSSDDSIDDPDFELGSDSSSDSNDDDRDQWNRNSTPRKTLTSSKGRPYLLSGDAQGPGTSNQPSTSSHTSTSSIERPDLVGQNVQQPGKPGYTDSEVDWVKRKIENISWHMPTHDDPPAIEVTVPWSGMKEIYAGILANAEPIEYFELFLSPDIITKIVEETNLYATQYLLATDISNQSRLHGWQPVTVDEMYSFLALIGWMGVVKLPAIRDYWRTHLLYGIPLARTVMARNRFEMILKFIHFSDNQTANTEDRLYKVRDGIDMFIKNYQKVFTPGEKICVDESLVAWRGRLLFRQYIPNKAAKYGIKIFKLCTDKGYTWNLLIYCGKSQNAETEVSENTVMVLAKDLLGDGRTLYTDNYYTSVPLAYRLRKNKTHLVGTLRANRKYLPRDVMCAKLRRGDFSAKQTDDGIVVLNWRDKRDVRMLSTKTSALKTLPNESRRGPTIQKPICIFDYNNGKSSIDISDQMATYGSALRRCTKWYRKLMFEIIWGTSLVNAHFLYNANTIRKKLTITEFREQVLASMFAKASRHKDSNPGPSRTRREETHHLVTNIQDGQKVRGRCSECYKKYGRQGIKNADGKIVRASQVNTKCSVCNIIICKKCYNATH